MRHPLFSRSLLAPRMPPTSSSRHRFSLLWLGALIAVLALGAWILSQRTARKRPPDHWQAVAKAQAYLDRGRPDLAFLTVSRIRDAGPGGPEAITMGARAMLMQPGADVLVARKALEYSLKLKPDQPEALKLLAGIYLAEGNGRTGIALLQHAARLDASDFRPWFAMGRAYYELREPASSADAYAQALKRSPPMPEKRQSQLGRIRSLLEANEIVQAEQELASARKQDLDSAELLALAARGAYRTGDAAAASELADRALALSPDQFDALMVRAEVQNQSGQPEPALADLKHATSLRPDDLGALQLLLQVQTRLGQSEDAGATSAHLKRVRAWNRAAEELSRAISKAPDDPQLRLRLAQAAIEAGSYTLAYQAFRAALDLDPSLQPAREGLAALKASGNLPGAQGSP